jgi:hypothetical protein
LTGACRLFVLWLKAEGCNSLTSIICSNDFILGRRTGLDVFSEVTRVILFEEAVRAEPLGRDGKVPDLILPLGL